MIGLVEAKDEESCTLPRIDGVVAPLHVVREDSMLQVGW